jgi:hypothetical protein
VSGSGTLFVCHGDFVVPHRSRAALRDDKSTPPRSIWILSTERLALCYARGNI